MHKVKATIETILRDMTVMGSNIFNVRVGDIGSYVSEYPFKRKSGKGSGDL